MQREFTILKWAAGAGYSLPIIDDVDESKLLSLIIQNRLSERFLNRFIQERPDWYSKLSHGEPSWCSRGFLDQLFSVRAETQKTLTRQLQAVSEIRSALLPDNSPLIAIKGFAPYVLTGDIRYVRETRDIDLFYANQGVLYELLLKLGYSGQIHEGHEFARVVRDDIKIEVHRHALVWSYPCAIANTQSSDLAPARHPEYWEQKIRDNVAGKISCEDLVSHCACGMAPNTHVFVPDATMSVMTKVVHLLHHHLGGPCWHLPQLRMVELAEIWDLLRDTSFDKQAFSGLVEQFRSHDSLAFAGCLLEWCYGQNPFSSLFPEMCFPQQDSLLPQRFIYYGPWIAFQAACDLFLNRPPEEIIRQIIPNSVVASGNRTPKLYSVFIDGGEILRRAILLTEHGGKFPAQLTFTWNETSLAIDVLLPEPLADGLFYVAEVYYWVKIYRFATISADGGLLNDHHGDAVLLPQTQGYGVRLSLPWQELPDYFLKDRLAFLMLTVSRREENPTGNFYDPVIVLPLEITLE